MINLAVINLKILLKRAIRLICLILAVLMIIKLSILIYNEVKNVETQSLGLNNSISMIQNNLIISKSFADEEVKESHFKQLLSSELAVFSETEKEKEKNQEEVTEFEELAENNQIEEGQDEEKTIEETMETVVDEALQNVQTLVIQANNKKDVYTDIYQTVQIKNESDYSLTEEMVTPNIKYRNCKNIIIYHTHTCESYTPTENSQYTATGNFRTTDLNYSVVRVGTELSNQLAGKGYTVIHDTTYHDYPAYTGSYNRSLSTITNLLGTYQDVDCIFDIHRDALGNNSGYAPCVQIGDEIAAQLMFVIGTDGGGLSHPNWNRNLKNAIRVQQKANEMYPGLFKPIVLRNSRYNQHVSDGAAIIEVGATGNTLEQCNMSMKYLSNVLDEIMKE